MWRGAFGGRELCVEEGSEGKGAVYGGRFWGEGGCEELSFSGKGRCVWRGGLGGRELCVWEGLRGGGPVEGRCVGGGV